MQKINLLTEDIRTKLLDFLYRDEVLNVFLIHFLENWIPDVGEIYISESHSKIDNVLHIKFDGNSYFTSFFCDSRQGLKAISEQLEALKYDRTLLAGKMWDVAEIGKYLNSHIKIIPNIYYKLDIDKFNRKTLRNDCKLRRAGNTKKDIDKIKKCLINSFEPQNEKQASDLTNEKKILEDINLGVYFLEHEKKICGMARFCGFTKKYADITTVYIDPEYRGRGYGKQLMKCMIETALSENKIPVTQVSVENPVARKIYEALGFIKQDDYAFEFIF